LWTLDELRRADLRNPAHQAQRDTWLEEVEVHDRIEHADRAFRAVHQQVQERFFQLRLEDRHRYTAALQQLLADTAGQRQLPWPDEDEVCPECEAEGH
jgi:hypothetical protein